MLDHPKIFECFSDCFLFFRRTLWLSGSLRSRSGRRRTGRRPFRGLEAADIAAATVLVGPPDVTLELDAGEIETLADLLADVRITRPDQSYSEYAGQTVLFTVTMADGTAANVTAYNPFLIIDGTGWRTAYAPCEALNRFANELLRERGG